MVRIRISAEAGRVPAPGLVGAFGGTNPGTNVSVSIDKIESPGAASLLMVDGANAVVQILKGETVLTAEAEVLDGTRVTDGTLRHEVAVGGECDCQRGDDLEDRA